MPSTHSVHDLELAVQDLWAHRPQDNKGGYVKSLVYADKPQAPEHLEDNIRRVIADIRQQMLEKVIENWTSISDYIRSSRGSHMPEIIFEICFGRVVSLKQNTQRSVPKQAWMKADDDDEARHESLPSMGFEHQICGVEVQYATTLDK
ncbi:hypothetical protein TNCV_333871 [Trichonephila clavipes]|nr:hypothetical protein TNCV_333871 [Trichonephila clavipes]